MSNTATSGSTTTLNLDQPLPAITYTAYRLYALGPPGNFTWRRYLVVPPGVGAAMQQVFPYPFAYSNGGAASVTQAPIGMVYYGNSASNPATWNSSQEPIVVDPGSGTITFDQPTSLVYGGGTVATPPTNVEVFVPVANGALEVFTPPSGTYSGTMKFVEGVNRVKVVTCRDWTDYSLNQNMAAFSNELFQSCCDVVLEGSITYLGLLTGYLSPGQAVQITGSGYLTGWECQGIGYPQITAGGTGFTSAPALTVSGGGGTGGTLACSVLNGAIVSVWITALGSGYTSTPSVAIGGPGTGADHAPDGRRPGRVMRRQVSARARRYVLRHDLEALQPASTVHERDIRQAPGTRSGILGTTARAGLQPGVRGRHQRHQRGPVARAG